MTRHKEPSQNIAVLMGPTGSGKSAMALAIAASRPTVIINADAMQMVSTLRILSARPSVEEEAQAEHALYGVLAPHEPTSVATWLKLVEPIITRALAEGKLPLLVGGTGMYLKALMEGLNEIPPIPENIRQKYRALVPTPAGGRLGGGRSGHSAEDMSEQVTPPPQPSPCGGGRIPQSLHALLTTHDPRMAAQLKPGDTQRLIRALEVIEATGKSLAEWQQQSAEPLFPSATYHTYFMEVPRAETYRRIDLRFEKMMQMGALKEAKSLLALLESGKITPAHPNWQTAPVRDWITTLPPIFRAHGIPELFAYLRGEMTLEAAITKAQQHTRNYAKRQLTWLRNQLPEAVALTSPEKLKTFTKS